VTEAPASIGRLLQEDPVQFPHQLLVLRPLLRLLAAVIVARARYLQQLALALDAHRFSLSYESHPLAPRYRACHTPLLKNPPPSGAGRPDGKGDSHALSAGSSRSLGRSSSRRPRPCLTADPSSTG